MLFRSLTRILQSLSYLGFAAMHPDEVLDEAADGVYQIVPPNVRPTLRTLALPVKIMLAAARANPEQWLAECHATLVSLTEETEEADLATFTETALLERIETISQRVLAIFPTRFANLPAGIFADVLFPKLLRLAVGMRARSEERRVGKECRL